MITGERSAYRSHAGSLTYFDEWTLKGSYVVAGTAMRNLGRGNIVIKGIPAGSKPVAAYLYWNIISPKNTTANKTGKFNGVTITGAAVGQAPTPCWGGGTDYSWTYRATVTSLVTATNKTYNLTNFASGVTDGSEPGSAVVMPLLEGASLVIIYSQSAYPTTTILLYNGAVTTNGILGPADTAIAPFPAYKSYLAYTSFIVADGQKGATKSGLFNGAFLPQADFNGTDPKITGGSYSTGNLWDTETPANSNTAKLGISVGKYIAPGATAAVVGVHGDSDCLVHVAQVFAVSNGELDTDGDALLNGWEGNGYGRVDLPALGANPFHKDVFLEIDYMGEVHMPTPTVVSKMKSSFAAGNVVNPDKKTGVALHVDVSTALPHETEFTTTSGCGDLFTKLETTKTAYMDPDRFKIFHYQLWVHDLCVELGSTSGYAQAIPGDDSFVSLGSWPGEGDQSARIGTSLHELGHTLNLRHGFPTGKAGDGGADDPYTPNHVSIMSYIYQVSGVIKNGAFGTFDYQRWNLPALNENCLDETKGVGTLTALDTYGLKWNTSGTVWRQNLTPGSANGPLDWNGNGSIQTCASISINKDADKETLQATKSEWPLIVYNGGDIGLGAEYGLNIYRERIPVYHMTPLVDTEMTFEDAVNLLGK